MIQGLREILKNKTIAKKLGHTEDYTRQLIAGYKGNSVSESIEKEVALEVIEHIKERFIKGNCEKSWDTFISSIQENEKIHTT